MKAMTQTGEAKLRVVVLDLTENLAGTLHSTFLILHEYIEWKLRDEKDIIVLVQIRHIPFTKYLMGKTHIASSYYVPIYPLSYELRKKLSSEALDAYSLLIKGLKSISKLVDLHSIDIRITEYVYYPIVIEAKRPGYFEILHVKDLVIYHKSKFFGPL